MQSLDDEFPYTSEDPSLAPIEPQAPINDLPPQQLSDLKSTLRLLLGSTLNGSDLLVQRLRKMQAGQESVKPEAVIIDENETPQDRLRYLLLGILFETPDAFQHAFETADKVASSFFDFFSRLLSPVTEISALNPLQKQYDDVAARGEKIIDRLIMKGRIEEQNSRQLLQEKAVNDLLNEFVEYLVLKTEVRRIIQEEGVSVAGDVVGEFQEESANVDTLLEQKLRSIFKHGNPPQSVNTSSNQPGEGTLK